MAGVFEVLARAALPKC